jgi:hypothetical protein
MLTSSDWLSAVVSGIGGGLLVFVLTELVTRLKERRDFEAALLSVIDELAGLGHDLDAAGNVGAARPQGLAPHLETPAYDAARVMLARHLPWRSWARVSSAYRGLNYNVRFGIGDPTFIAVLAVARPPLQAAQSELERYYARWWAHPIRACRRRSAWRAERSAKAIAPP